MEHPGDWGLGRTEVSTPISTTDKVLTLQTGTLAPQAAGAVVGRIGDTVVLVTAVAGKEPREGVDFFPLTVDVEERMYAVGKIPGSFFRREGKASEQATLTCRLIDRPLRPSFSDGFRNEVQVVVTVLGGDMENPYDVLAINAASAALMASGLPFEGPIGAVRICYDKTGKWVPHPTFQEGDESSFELVVAGRVLENNDVAIMMVEAGGTESSWENYQGGAPKVTEDVIVEGLEMSKTWIRESVELQKQFIAKMGEPTKRELPVFAEYQDDVLARVTELGEARYKQAFTIADKTERNGALDEITSEIKTTLAEEFEDRGNEVKAAIKSVQKKVVRKRIADEGIRMDGRTTTQLRPLHAEVGLLPTAHGSGLFQRGETQVLNVCTLAMPKMEQMLDTITTDEKKRYMHHYNMPPYANNEPGRIGPTKRREIGHGALGERALLPVVPSAEEFPYTIRTVSEVLSSNGSTSQASICGSTLSMLDAGVPLRASIGGIAMGLIYTEGKYITLTDILGSEDAFGDMDFKVAGSSEFVTALQLDTKIDGIPAEVLGQALRQAHDARMEILEVMNSAISEHRTEINARAPKIVNFEIPIDRIGEIIGPKGKVINQIQADSGAEVNIDEQDGKGVVIIGAIDTAQMEAARSMIELILNPPEPEMGVVYDGTVVNVTKFGAFINILPGRDGLLHISKMGGGERVNRVEDYYNVGDKVQVVVEALEPGGKLGLSLAGDAPAPVAGESTTSEDGANQAPAERSERGPRTDREGRETVSFQDSWDAEAAEAYGIEGEPERRPRPGGNRGGPRRGGNGGGDRGRSRGRR